MQSWIPEIWQAAVIGLVVGVILGYVLLRLTKGSVKKQVQTEAELKEVKTQLSDKQAQLEDVYKRQDRYSVQTLHKRN